MRETKDHKFITSSILYFTLWVMFISTRLPPSKCEHTCCFWCRLSVFILFPVMPEKCSTAIHTFIGTVCSMAETTTLIQKQVILCLLLILGFSKSSQAQSDYLHICWSIPSIMHNNLANSHFDDKGNYRPISGFQKKSPPI